MSSSLMEWGAATLTSTEGPGVQQNNLELVPLHQPSSNCLTPSQGVSSIHGEFAWPAQDQLLPTIVTAYHFLLEFIQRPFSYGAVPCLGSLLTLPLEVAHLTTEMAKKPICRLLIHPPTSLWLESASWLAVSLLPAVPSGPFRSASSHPNHPLDSQSHA